jgi:biopolymer transport protein ExbD
MIDVVFQLLLFFLVVSRFSDEEREMKVVLPQASEAKPLISKPREFFVNIDRTGQYYVGGKTLDLSSLDQQLMQLAANNPGKQSVVIRADKRCQWEFVVAVMNACNKAEIRDYRVTTAQIKGGE